MPQTPSGKDDFRSQFTDLAALLRGSRGHALAGMLAGARTDPALARAMHAQWLEPRRKWGIQRMTSAAEAGQLNDGVDIQAALAVLYGPLYTPLPFGRSVPGAIEVQRILDVALAGVFKSG